MQVQGPPKKELPTKFDKAPIHSWSCPELEDHYGKLVEIGSGTYGCVYRAQSLRDRRVVALKKMSYLQDQNNKYEEGFPITTLREIKLLQNLNHHNILNINEVLIKHVRKQLPVVHICLDYMDYDLDKLVHEKQFQMNVSQIRFIMRQILNGLEYLHDNDVVHRDLKPQNILVSKAGDIKIADFGLAKMIRNKIYLTVRVVTLWYRAPELLLGQRNYNCKIDMWSMGCLMAELMLRRPLFYHQQSERELINKIFELFGTPDNNDWEEEVKKLDFYKEVKPPSSMENEFIFQMKKLCPLFQTQSQLLDLLSKMMSLNPHKRLSASEALAHSFFQLPDIPHGEFLTPDMAEVLNRKSRRQQQPLKQKRAKH